MEVAHERRRRGRLCVETDSGGVYEAHIVEAGEPLTVLVGEDFEITGTQSGPGGHGPGGRDGEPGDRPDGGATDSGYRQS